MHHLSLSHPFCSCRHWMGHLHVGWMKFFLELFQQPEGTVIRECLTAIWPKSWRSESVQNLWRSQRATCSYRTHLPWNQTTSYPAASLGSSPLSEVMITCNCAMCVSVQETHVCRTQFLWKSIEYATFKWNWNWQYTCGRQSEYRGITWLCHTSSDCSVNLDLLATHRARCRSAACWSLSTHYGGHIVNP